jgi:hypothetical protein
MVQRMPEVHPYDVEEYLERNVRDTFMKLKKDNLKSIICHLETTFPDQARWKGTPGKGATREDLRNFF